MARGPGATGERRLAPPSARLRLRGRPGARRPARPDARSPRRLGHARLGSGARVRGARRHVRRPRVAHADTRPSAARGRGRARSRRRARPSEGRCVGSPRAPPPRGRARRGRVARAPPLARRGARRGRRLLPPRTDPEAARVRRPLAREHERVPGRRAASRLRVPALARLPRARREGVGRRSGGRRAPRPDGAGPACGARRLRGGLGAVPASGTGCDVGGRRHRARRDGSRARRRTHGARAAGDRVTPAPRPGGARARARGGAPADARAPRDDRGGVSRARRGASDLRAVSLPPVRGLRRRPLALGATRRRVRRVGPRRARRSRRDLRRRGCCRSSPIRPR